MKIKIIVTPTFKSDYKKLKSKYRKLPDELDKLQNVLLENPKTGESLGGGIYKIRLANKDKNKGKRAGFRIITYTVVDNLINLLTIYDKSEKSTIKTSLLKKMIKEIKK